MTALLEFEHDEYLIRSLFEARVVRRANVVWYGPDRYWFSGIRKAVRFYHAARVVSLYVDRCKPVMRPLYDAYRINLATTDLDTILETRKRLVPYETEAMQLTRSLGVTKFTVL